MIRIIDEYLIKRPTARYYDPSSMSKPERLILVNSQNMLHGIYIIFIKQGGIECQSINDLQPKM
jgi:hypothetical protein